MSLYRLVMIVVAVIAMTISSCDTKSSSGGGGANNNKQEKKGCFDKYGNWHSPDNCPSDNFASQKNTSDGRYGSGQGTGGSGSYDPNRGGYQGGGTGGYQDDPRGGSQQLVQLETTVFGLIAQKCKKCHDSQAAVIDRREPYFYNGSQRADQVIRQKSDRIVARVTAGTMPQNAGTTLSNYYDDLQQWLQLLRNSQYSR